MKSRRPFVTQIQKAAHQMGAIAGWTSPPSWFVKNTILPRISNIDYLSKKAGQLLSGYNPDEARP